jgi:hypothetical protein
MEAQGTVRATGTIATAGAFVDVKDGHRLAQIPGMLDLGLRDTHVLVTGVP